MRRYCTLFDRNYVSRGLALHSSLMRNGGDFRLYVLCLDDPTLDALSELALPRVEVISAAVLEAWDPELLASRANRNAVEYYFTCKPVLLRYLLSKVTGADRVTYLDSDLYLFSDLAAAEAEFAGSAVALTPHRFPQRIVYMRRSGVFNAGWVSVSAAGDGPRFVDWWRARCIEWCLTVFEETRFGDQKYLDQVPGLFRDVVSISHPGVNAAPWNVDAFQIDVGKDGVRIGGRPLVAFHFHGIRRIAPRLYDSGLYIYRARLTKAAREGIYRPYLKELAHCDDRLSRLPEAIRRTVKPALASAAGRSWRARAMTFARVLASRTALAGP